MTSYKHTQVGYLMLIVTLAVLGLFAWVYLVASVEPLSVDAGPNFVISIVMVLTLLVISSFSTLTVLVDEKYVRIRFAYGIYRRKFSINEISSVKRVKNHWYHGWGIRMWFWPRYMLIYNVSGFEAVEIIMKNGKIYRIGTDVPEELNEAIRQFISLK